MMKWLKNLSPRERAFVILAALILMIAAVDRLIAAPVRAEIKAKQEQINARAVRLATFKSNIEELPEVRQAYEQYSDYLRRVGSDEKELSIILGQIEEIAREADVSLLDTKTRATEDHQWYKMYNVEIEIESTPEELVGFLYLLNQNPRGLRVEKLQVTPRGASSLYIGSSMLITRMVSAGSAEQL